MRLISRSVISWCLITAIISSCSNPTTKSQVVETKNLDMSVRIEHELENGDLSLNVSLRDLNADTSFLDPSSLVLIGNSDTLSASINEMPASFTQEGALLTSFFNVPILQSSNFQLRRADDEVYLFEVNFIDDMLYEITAKPTDITLDDTMEISLSVDSKSGAVVDGGIGSTRLQIRHIDCQSTSNENLSLDYVADIESYTATLPFSMTSSRSGREFFPSQIVSRLTEGEFTKCDVELAGVRRISLSGDEIPPDPYIASIQSQEDSPISASITVYSKPIVVSIFR